MGVVWTTFNNVPVGPELGQPGGLRRDARHAARPGQPRGRRPAPRRGPVPVEAARHRLPEPARGAPDPPGLPGAGPDRRARRWRSRPRRSSRRTTWCSTSARTTRYRPECDLAYHNQLMVMLWSSIATRDARLATRGPAPAAARAAPSRLGDLRPLPRRHRLGGLGRGRLGRRLEPASTTGGSWRSSSPGGFAGQLRPGRALPGQPGHRRRPHLGQRRGAVRPGGRARAPATRPRHRRRTAAGAALLRRLLLRRDPVALHGRRARPAQRPDWADDPRRPTTTAGCTGRPWTGSVAERRHDPARSRAGSSRRCSGWRPCAVPSRRSRWVARPSRWTRRMTTCSGTCAPTRAGTPSSWWRTSGTRLSARAWTGSRACCGPPALPDPAEPTVRSSPPLRARLTRRPAHRRPSPSRRLRLRLAHRAPPGPPG